MALKAVVASLDEVEEKYRPLYVAAGDGKFKLDAEGIEDVGGLKSALAKERTSRETFEKELAKLKKEIDGLDPDKARAAIAKVQALEEKKLIEEGKVDELITQRTDQMRKDHEAQVKQFQTQLETEKTTSGKLTSELRKLRLDGGIRELAVKKGVRPEAVADAIARMTVLGVGDGDQAIRWDMRDGKIVALRGEAVAYGKDANASMSLDEGLDLLATQAKHLFLPNQGGGAQNTGGATGPMGGVFQISREDARDARKYSAAKAAAEKAGQTLQIAAETSAA